MTLRQLLFPQARAALFDPPTDIRSIARHYTFSIEDLTMIRQRRRNANRLGFAVHLAYLRFPGRVLSPKETPSAYMLAFIADQLRIAAAPTRANPREEFADVLRELGGDLTGEHPIMDGRPHRMATLDDDRGEKSIFYVAHADGRPAGYAKNNRTGEEQRWKASAVTMTKEQFTAIAPGKVAEREADRVALYERTADRLSAHIEAYPALSPDHDYLKAKRISLEPGVFETPRGSMAIPAFDADGKLWSVQYVNSDGSKRFARESRKEGCFHMVGSTDPVGDLAKAAAIVVAEGYATAATLKSLHAEAGDPRGRVAFVAGFDAGNLPYVAQALRERYADAAMVIAADNDKAREGQEPGRNPGLIMSLILGRTEQS
jgi:putative DNA primase/helicase